MFFSPAFSTPAISCRVFHSGVFSASINHQMLHGYVLVGNAPPTLGVLASVVDKATKIAG